MLIQVGLENGFEGKSTAWLLDHPGCFVYGRDGSEAILKVPRALIAYKEWMGKHQSDSWLTDLGDFDVRLVEVLESDPIGKSEPNWFQHDGQPLTQMEVDHALKLLSWSRNDLLELVNQLSSEELDRTYEGERWPIRGILEHVAGAEFWYLDRLGLTGMPQSQLYVDVFERLAQVRKRMEQALPILVGNAEVREIDGEMWSGRKILRRAAWHEMDHIQHILRLMTHL